MANWYAYLGQPLFHSVPFFKNCLRSSLKFHATTLSSKKGNVEGCGQYRNSKTIEEVGGGLGGSMKRKGMRQKRNNSVFWVKWVTKENVKQKRRSGYQKEEQRCVSRSNEVWRYHDVVIFVKRKQNIAFSAYRSRFHQDRREQWRKIIEQEECQNSNFSNILAFQISNSKIWYLQGGMAWNRARQIRKFVMPHCSSV